MVLFSTPAIHPPIGKEMKAPYKLSLTITAILLVALAFSGIVDKTGERYTDAAFKRALLTFAVARGLNAAISVAQGTEVAISPAGLGLNLAPGQILDPVNDLVERFSWVMMMSSTSLGIQKIFLEISSSLGASILLAIVILLALYAAWRPGHIHPLLRSLLPKLALIVLILRFAVPVAAIASEWVYSYFLADHYQESTQMLEETRAQIVEINQTEPDIEIPPADDSLMDRARRWLDSASDSLGVGERMERYRAAAAEASEHAINLIVVFVIQTVILPLLFIWLMIRALRRVIG